MLPGLIQQRIRDLEQLCRTHGVRRLELFGSATTNQFDPSRSDLDFLVEFFPASAGEHTQNYFGLLFDLETMFGPRQVDLVEREGVRNPYVLAKIEQHRVKVYAAA